MDLLKAIIIKLLLLLALFILLISCNNKNNFYLDSSNVKQINIISHFNNLDELNNKKDTVKIISEKISISNIVKQVNDNEKHTSKIMAEHKIELIEDKRDVVLLFDNSLSYFKVDGVTYKLNKGKLDY